VTVSTSLPRRSRLLRALSFGPRAAAREISRLLGDGVAKKWEVAGSPDWLSDLYAASLNERQRACMRDAVVLGISRPGVSANPRLDFNLLKLARQIELLAVGSPEIGRRLWVVARRRLRTGEASGAIALVALLASAGQHRSADHWDAVANEFGDEVAVLCFQAIARGGVGEALDWARVRYARKADLRETLWAGVLPLYVRDAPRELADYYLTLDDDVFAWELYDALEAQGLSIGEHAPPFDFEEFERDLAVLGEVKTLDDLLDASDKIDAYGARPLYVAISDYVGGAQGRTGDQ